MPVPTIAEADSDYKFSGNLRIKVQSGTGIDVQPTQGGIIILGIILQFRKIIPKL